MKRPEPVFGVVMQRYFTSAAFAIGLTIILGFIFWGIIRLQGPKIPPGPPPDQKTIVRTEKEKMKKTEPDFVQREVNISFRYCSQLFHFDKIPLYESRETSTNLIEINIDGQIAANLLDSLPQPDELIPPLPAEIETDAKGLVKRIKRGTEGELIDKEGTLKAIEECVSANPRADELTVEIRTFSGEGSAGFQARREELGFGQLLAEFDTANAAYKDNEDRNTNLRIAAEKVDGLLIPPNGKFSFNKAVGARTAKNGFKPAGVISNGRVIPGLGGGICQVSTTLYRVALLANMKITERHNHSIYEGIDYAERGLDAAVAWGHKDFCFTNTLPYPILISCKAGPGTVFVAFHSEKRPFDEVIVGTRNEIKHPFEVQVRKNPKLKNIEKKVVKPGVTGYSIESYRTVKADGISKEERLSKDRYLTFPQIEEVGN